ncbi:MAG: MazG family protein [bacterium]|nr:MazG family protein [bacterium]
MSEIERLQEITRTLRAPGGCEWDRAQDYRSMRRYVLEETYELIHAIESQDFENLVEELGDLLFHVFFFAEMGAEEDSPERRFDLEDIARGISDKLVRRHPHVFGDVQVSGVGEILKNWDEIKANEKKNQKQAQQGGSSTENDARSSAIPAKTGRELPVLMRSEKIQKKAAKLGFDWREPGNAAPTDGAPTASHAKSAGALAAARSVLKKVEEELAEVAAEIDRLESTGQSPRDAAPDMQSRLEDEIGDVFFSVVNLARHLRVEPEGSAHRANEKFLRRFHAMEAIAADRGLNFAALDEAQLDELWQQAKRVPA